MSATIFLFGKDGARKWIADFSLRQASTVVGLILLLSCGCSSSQVVRPPLNVTKGGRLYSVAVENAGFYRYDPRQGNAPDQRLSRETLLKLIHPSFGYSKVQLLSGEQGYVASDEIEIAAPTLIAALTAPPPDIASSQIRKSRLDPNDPRLIAPPEPLPLDLPEPTPIPGTEAPSGQY